METISTLLRPGGYSTVGTDGDFAKVLSTEVEDSMQVLLENNFRVILIKENECPNMVKISEQIGMRDRFSGVRTWC